MCTWNVWSLCACTIMLQSYYTELCTVYTSTSTTALWVDTLQPPCLVSNRPSLNAQLATHKQGRAPCFKYSSGNIAEC